MSECPHLELVGGQQRLAWECALLKGSNCHWKQHEDCPRYLTARAEAALASLAELRIVAEGLRDVLGERDFSSLDDDDWAAIDAYDAWKKGQEGRG